MSALAACLHAMGIIVRYTYLGVKVEKDHGNRGAFGWQHHAWECTIINPRNDETMTAAYRAGMGHKNDGKPSPEALLSCVLSDAHGASGLTFEEWAGEYGFDSDSIRALRTFEACQQTEKDLLRLFGEDEFQRLNTIAMDDAG